MPEENNPSLLDIYREVTEVKRTLKEFCQTVEKHDRVLFGSNNPETGLVWAVRSNQKDIGFFKKAVLALVPGTGIVWTAVYCVLKVLGEIK